MLPITTANMTNALPQVVRLDGSRFFMRHNVEVSGAHSRSAAGADAIGRPSRLPCYAAAANLRAVSNLGPSDDKKKYDEQWIHGKE
jgi:hypothetical protein